MAKTRKEEDYYPMSETPKSTSVQKWRQQESKRFEDYTAAKEYFDSLPEFREQGDGKKRIRRRSSGHFDVLTFIPLPENKETA